MRALTYNLYHVPWTELFKVLRENFPGSRYDFKKHQILVQDTQHNEFGYIRLPLHIQLNEQLQLLGDEATVIYLSIESGNAALHLWEGQELEYHTTFGAYMTRKKQGFSQVKYLNKKGKSRAGSRIRLKSTEVFFEQINDSLNDLFEEYLIDRIAISCGATLWPYLFASKVTCPFDKQDERLYKIPLHLPQSNHHNVLDAVKKLKAPVLFYEEQYAVKLAKLLTL